jgi:hypothetical protein
MHDLVHEEQTRKGRLLDRSAAGDASVASDQALAFERDRHLIDRKRGDPGGTQLRHSSIKWMLKTEKAHKKVAHACLS